MKSKSIEMNRRDFLKASALLGAGLLIGCKTEEAAGVLAAGKSDNLAPGAWLHIAPDGQVTFMLPSVEMGQGVYTSLSQLICEELDGVWENFHVRLAPLHAETYARPGFLNMQSTGGSSSVREWSPVLRKVGATARLQLRKAAAERWNVSVAECATEPGAVVHKNGKRLGYGELALDAARLVPAEDTEVELKKPSEFRLIGKDMPRLDTPLKTNGQAQYGIDVSIPEMVYATVEFSPVFGGSVKSYNRDAALKMKGVSDVVELDGGVAVIADSYYRAKMGLFALKPKFEGGDRKFSSAGLRKALREKIAGTASEPAPGAKTLEAEYEVPFLAHSCMEPINCTVRVSDDKCEIWTPSQNLTLVGQTAERVTGMSLDKIHIQPTFLGGGFGRRLETDFIAQALEIAMAIKKPVKLVWSREEDTRHDFYRPASMARFEVTLNESGLIKNWRQVVASPEILDRIWKEWNVFGLGFLPYNFFADDVAMEGTEHPFSATHDISLEALPTPVPIGFWRSVGDSHNGFYVQSMMDEAAHAAGIDPVDFLRKHLEGQDQYLGVLDLVAEKGNWGKAPKGRFQGVAIHGSFQSVVAHVVEISVKPDKSDAKKNKLKIHRITTAVDVGLAVNPAGVIAQVESSIIWGLTATLMGEITIKDGKVQQSNFHDVEMLRMAQVPDMDVHIVPSQNKSTGIGEPAVPPLAPAITNAIFAATGQRLRSMPLKRHGFAV